MLKIVITLGLLLLTAFAAADFRGEAVATYGDGDGDGTDTEVYGVTARWFFKPVKTESVPLAEAGFLSQTSFVRYAYTKEETELNLRPLVLDFVPPGGAVSDPGLTPLPRPQPPTRTIGGVNVLLQSPEAERKQHQLTYRQIHAPSGWFGEIRAGVSNGDVTLLTGGNVDGQEVRLEVGRYVTETTSVQAHASVGEVESKSRFQTSCTVSLFCVGIASNSRNTTDTQAVGLSARHVGTIAGHYFGIDGFAEYAEQDIELRNSVRIIENPLNLPIQTLPSSAFDVEVSGIWRAGASLRWYFNPKLSVAGAYALNSVRTQQDHSYTLSGQWFITEHVALQLQANRLHIEGPGADIDSLVFSVVGRL